TDRERREAVDDRDGDQVESVTGTADEAPRLVREDAHSWVEVEATAVSGVVAAHERDDGAVHLHCRHGGRPLAESYEDVDAATGTDDEHRGSRSERVWRREDRGIQHPL